MKIFYLPDLGEGLAEAEIREWYVKPGDTVKVDQPLVSMETAKAVVDVPSPQAGTIEKLHGKSGDIIPTGSALVEYVGEKDAGTVVGSLEESGTALDEGDMIIGAPTATKTTIKAMPAVRALAKELQVDLNLVKPTGPNGQITVEDVKKFSEKKTVPAANSSVQALHGVRRSMAIAMAQSHHEVVPVTLVEDADLTHLSDKADLTVHIIKAIIHAAGQVPALNAWYDGKSMERCLHKEIHIGLAIDTEEGLFVPVIKDAAKKSDSELRKSIDGFKASVRTRTAAPSDFQGATFTLSNFGMIAGRYANPIIVPPQVAILGCGKIRDEAKPIAKKIEIRRILPLSLTFDHRAVTGGEAARFLGEVVKDLESNT